MPTSNAVAMTASTTSGATNLALLPVDKQLETTFQTTPVQHIPANISATLLSSLKKASIPYKTAGFDKDNLHPALPIWGILPENNLHNNSKKEVQQTQVIQPNSISATWPQKSRWSQATLDSQTDRLGHNDAGRIGNSIRNKSPDQYPQQWCWDQMMSTKMLRSLALEKAYWQEPLDSSTNSPQGFQVSGKPYYL